MDWLIRQLNSIEDKDLRISDFGFEWFAVIL